MIVLVLAITITIVENILRNYTNGVVIVIVIRIINVVITIK